MFFFVFFVVVPGLSPLVCKTLTFTVASQTRKKRDLRGNGEIESTNSVRTSEKNPSREKGFPGKAKNRFQENKQRNFV